MVAYVFGKIKDTCQKFGGTTRGMGFTHSDTVSDGYFNLREIVRCIDANMEGEDIPTESGTYRVVLKDERINLVPTSTEK